MNSQETKDHSFKKNSLQLRCQMADGYNVENSYKSTTIKEEKMDKEYERTTLVTIPICLQRKRCSKSLAIRKY